MARYNLDSLREEADALSVAEYIGMDIFSNGSRHYIYCPGHEERLGKPDRKADNCVLTKRGYRCFACGVWKDVFEMVMEFMGCGLHEAFGIVGDACGGRHYFIEKGDKNSKEPEVLPIKRCDLELIGLNSRRKRVNSIIGSGFKERQDCINVKALGETDQFDDYYLYYTREDADTLYSLYKEDPQLFKQLILTKATYAAIEYKNMMDLVCKGKSPLSAIVDIAMGREVDNEFLYQLRNVYKEKYNRCREIILNYCV
ncbi:MAG: hypothetical protein GX969_08885 [Firmicutes bacterium]|nr:hypothetical protein [Bacillota bacterium]